MTLTRSKKLVFGVLLAGLSLCIVFAATEVALRLRERHFIQSFREAGDEAGVIPSDIPGLNYTLRPYYRHGNIVFNQYGFNMPDLAAAKKPGTRRIMMVGDSVTQGVGIDATEQAVPNLIHQLLQQDDATLGWEVWNAGVGGYNADQILLQMRHLLPAFEPDVIIYIFNFNDYWEPNQYFYGQPGIPPDQLQEKGKSGWLDRLKKIRVVLFLRDRIHQLAYHIRGYPPVYVDQKISYPSWLHMKSVVAEMNQYCRLHGIDFAVVIHPNQQFLFVDPDKNIAHRDVLALLNQHAIPHLDLIPCLKPHRHEDIYLPDGNHMNPVGYALVADCITLWMRSTFLTQP